MQKTASRQVVLLARGKAAASRTTSLVTASVVVVSAGVVVVYAGVVVVLAGVVAVLGHSREDALVRPGYELSVTILNISTVIYVQRIVKRKVVLRGGRPQK